MGFFKFYKEEVEVIKDRDPAIKKILKQYCIQVFGRFIIIEKLINYI